ncbi:hypothetical protein [Nitrosomonas sp. Nm34]|uniref:hypothetical protein n=1 Tax=Nitrosomonas sp. Nm34 TaxID=1881055 RepID=UPI00111357C6|nr:hypothetical protein [Nitrosomonas sp. Nm34]
MIIIVPFSRDSCPLPRYGMSGSENRWLVPSHYMEAQLEVRRFAYFGARLGTIHNYHCITSCYPLTTLITLSQTSDRRINSPELSRLCLQIDEESKVVFLRCTEPTDTNRTRAEPELPVMARLRTRPHVKQPFAAASSEFFLSIGRNTMAAKLVEATQNCPG